MLGHTVRPITIHAQGTHALDRVCMPICRAASCRSPAGCRAISASMLEMEFGCSSLFGVVRDVVPGRRRRPGNRGEGTRSSKDRIYHFTIVNINRVREVQPWFQGSHIVKVERNLGSPAISPMPSNVFSAKERNTKSAIRCSSSIHAFRRGHLSVSPLPGLPNGNSIQP